MTLPTAATVFARLPRVLRRHRLMRAWMSLTGEDKVQLVPVREGARGYADMGDGFLRLIVIDGNFEHDFFRIADSMLRKGGVFVDAGANYGLLSFGLAARFDSAVQFHLFEPNPQLVATIRRTAPLYPRMRLELNQAAVGDLDGEVAFSIDDAQTGASHVAEDAATAYLASHAIEAVYFEYFEKWLQRVQPPAELLRYLSEMKYEVCLCRESDVVGRGGATHTIREGLPGNGLALLPLGAAAPPKMTDLLAIPKENIVSLAR